MSFLWTIRGGRILRPAPFCVSGILNITPDSFATGQGALPPLEQSVGQGLAMLDELADLADLGPGLLDMGGESTRPGAPAVSEAEEQARLMPVLTRLMAARPEALISVDTTRAAIARQALSAGAMAINDVSGAERDPGLLDILAEYQPGYVLMHSSGNGGKGGAVGHLPENEKILDHILHFFETGLTRLAHAGLPADHVVLDPGIGFGKTSAQNWAVLQNLPQLDTETRLGRPLYLGLSLKSLFGMLPGEDGPARRKTVTQTTVALCSAAGVRYHRVHHVTDTATTLRVVRQMSGLQDVSSSGNLNFIRL